MSSGLRVSVAVGMEPGEEREASKPSLCSLPSLCVSLSVPSQALKEFQLEFQIGHTRCGGARGSESEPPARAAAGLQDGAGSQATAAAPGFLPARGC